VKKALGAYTEIDVQLPVPKPKPYLSARKVFFYLLLFTIINVSAFNFGNPAVHVYRTRTALSRIRRTIRDIERLKNQRLRFRTDYIISGLSQSLFNNQPRTSLYAIRPDLHRNKEKSCLTGNGLPTSATANRESIFTMNDRKISLKPWGDSGETAAAIEA
jgi:hypothetical protein